MLVARSSIIGSTLGYHRDQPIERRPPLERRRVGGLQWKKVVPGEPSHSFVRVSDDWGAPVVAGAFQRSDDAGPNKFSLTNDAFFPGVYDETMKTCVIRDDLKTEDQFFALTKGSSVEYDWVPAETDGHLPSGAIQCGFGHKGEPLYVGRFLCDGRLLCGQINEDLNRCDVKIPETRFSSNHYDVLCLKTVPIGLSYASAYNLRSQVTPPPLRAGLLPLNGNISPLRAGLLPLNGNTSPPRAGLLPLKGNISPLRAGLLPLKGNISPLPFRLSSPTVTRTITSSQNNSVTVRNMSLLQNAASMIISKSQPSTTPISQGVTPLSSLKPIHQRRVGKPYHKWQRDGPRLVRSPSGIKQFK